MGGQRSSTLTLDYRPAATRTLARVPYFTELGPECAPVLENLTRDAVQQNYAAGEIIFLEGEPCLGLYVVQSGWVQSVKLSPSGREQVIRVVGPGDAFNEVGVMAEVPRNMVTVIALEPTTVLLIRRETLLCAIDACPRLGRLVTRHLVERMQHLMSLIENLSLHPVEGRLARLLLDEATAETLPRHHWATQAEMAARVGTVRDVVSRVLRGLTAEGLIKVERHRIIILDRAGLEAKAGELE